MKWIALTAFAAVLAGVGYFSWSQVREAERSERIEAVRAELFKRADAGPLDALKVRAMCGRMQNLRQENNPYADQIVRNCRALEYL